jgi:hypothetical protein
MYLSTKKRLSMDSHISTKFRTKYNQDMDHRQVVVKMATDLRD